ncbi:hypothetical protein DL767_002770 [Monosporascus sp. MG133]|nr:hypothetical protein DL767_002770 [Monosporascus sp. MG133]
MGDRPTGESEVGTRNAVALPDSESAGGLIYPDDVVTTLAVPVANTQRSAVHLRFEGANGAAPDATCDVSRHAFFHVGAKNDADYPIRGIHHFGGSKLQLGNGLAFLELVTGSYVLVYHNVDPTAACFIRVTALLPYNSRIIVTSTTKYAPELDVVAAWAVVHVEASGRDPAAGRDPDLVVAVVAVYVDEPDAAEVAHSLCREDHAARAHVLPDSSLLSSATAAPAADVAIIADHAVIEAFISIDICPQLRNVLDDHPNHRNQTSEADVLLLVFGRGSSVLFVPNALAGPDPLHKEDLW